jgi:hypothetical protein
MGADRRARASGARGREAVSWGPSRSIKIRRRGSEPFDQDRTEGGPRGSEPFDQDRMEEIRPGRMSDCGWR